MSSDITFVDTFLCNSIKESKESLCDKFINGPLHRPHAPDPSMHYGWNRLQIKATSVVYYKFCVFLEKLYETLGSDKYILLSYGLL